jgi:hypothetical protein
MYLKESEVLLNMAVVSRSCDAKYFLLRVILFGGGDTKYNYSRSQTPPPPRSVTQALARAYITQDGETCVDLTTRAIIHDSV